LQERGTLAELFDDPPDLVPSTLQFYDDDQVILRGGDLDGRTGTFLRDDSGAVTYLRRDRLLIKEP
jgi:hypothetical protein